MLDVGRLWPRRWLTTLGVAALGVLVASCGQVGRDAGFGRPGAVALAGGGAANGGSNADAAGRLAARRANPAGPEGTCPPAPATAADAASQVAAAGDVDGDGRADQLTTYRSGPGQHSQSWRLRAELANGGGAEVVLTDVAGAAAVSVLGAAPLTGPGRPGGAEIFVSLGRAGGTSTIGLFALVGCELVRLGQNGGPAVFPVGAVAGYRVGLICEDGSPEGRLVGLSANGAGDSWKLSRVRYRREGASLAVAQVTNANVTQAELDAELARGCDGLHL